MKGKQVTLRLLLTALQHILSTCLFLSMGLRYIAGIISGGAMARRARLESPGAVYWVETRCIDGTGRALDAADRDRFMKILGHVVTRHRWICHAYCVLEAGYDLVVETPEANLSRGMRDLNGEFTQGYNRRRGRKGPVFKGRFGSWPVEKGTPLVDVCREVVLAPVRAGHVKKAGKWRWSSFGATAGADDQAHVVNPSWLLAQFGGRPKKARNRYEKFVKAGAGKALPSVVRVHFVGSEAFGAQLEPRQPAMRPPSKAPPGRPPLSRFLPRALADDHAQRDRRVAEAYLRFGYTLAELGGALGLHPATISRIVRKAERRQEESVKGEK